MLPLRFRAYAASSLFREMRFVWGSSRVVAAWWAFVGFCFPLRYFDLEWWREE